MLFPSISNLQLRIKYMDIIHNSTQWPKWSPVTIPQRSRPIPKSKLKSILKKQRSTINSIPNMRASRRVTNIKKLTHSSSTYGPKPEPTTYTAHEQETINRETLTSLDLWIAKIFSWRNLCYNFLLHDQPNLGFEKI